MSLTNIRARYVAELNDLYDAEQQILRELPLLSAGATSAALRDALDAHYVQTQQHVSRLEAIFRHLDEWPRAEPARALRALIEDSRLHNAHVEGQALDAALIAEAARIEHYEIAGYTSARTLAVSLSDLEGAELLQQTLDDEDSMDHRLARLASELRPEHELMPVRSVR